MKTIVGYVVPAVIIALAIPLALGIGPPNETYGFRTPSTLFSPAIWYSANRVPGWLTIIALLVTIGINFALSSRHPEWPELRLVLLMTGTLVASPLLAVTASLLLLRH